MELLPYKDLADKLSETHSGKYLPLDAEILIPDMNIHITEETKKMLHM